MASEYKTFWDNRSFAVVGHAAKKNFPRLTYHKWIMKLARKY
jgi:hypothetical protein